MPLSVQPEPVIVVVDAVHAVIIEHVEMAVGEIDLEVAHQARDGAAELGGLLVEDVAALAPPGRVRRSSA